MERDDQSWETASLLSLSEYHDLVKRLERRAAELESNYRICLAEREIYQRKCRVQRKLIEHLREKTRSVEFDSPVDVSADNREYPVPSDRTESRDSDTKIDSLNAALARITGVALVDWGDSRENTGIDEQFDAREFLPIDYYESGGGLSGWLRRFSASEA